MPLILGTNSIKDTGFNVDNSLRFNFASSDFLDRTPDSASNRRTFTFSCWVKRSVLDIRNLFSATGTDAARPDEIRFSADHRLYVSFRNTEDGIVATARLFRDVSAWYHIVVAVDTTQATAGNRVKIYVNGVQETTLTGDGAGDSATFPNEDFESLGFNQASNHQIGSRVLSTPTLYFDGYMSEVIFIDGSALAADQFGEFDSDSGIWKPINVSGLTFGTNGFYLQFKEAGTSQNSSGMGADTSGNDNHFAVNNLTALDQSTDTCTNNFATFNPLYLNSATTLSEGNLNLAAGGTGWYSHAATIGVLTGKFYFEVKCVSLGDGADTIEAMKIGIIQASDMGVDMEVNQNLGNYYQASGSTGNNGTVTSGTSSTRAAYTDGDIIGIALDMTNRKIYYHKNGTYIDSGDPAAGSNGYVIKSTFLDFLNPVVSVKYDGTVAQANFGSPSHAISSGNTDGDGYGNFEYAVPSGYYALNTKNLAEYG